MWMCSASCCTNSHSSGAALPRREAGQQIAAIQVHGLPQPANPGAAVCRLDVLVLPLGAEQFHECSDVEAVIAEGIELDVSAVDQEKGLPEKLKIWRYCKA